MGQTPGLKEEDLARHNAETRPLLIREKPNFPGTREGEGKKKKDAQRPLKKDTRYKTDVFGVKQAIREALRNMPFEDFKRLLSFILRGLKYILHNPDSPSYWHIDDPSFASATGLQRNSTNEPKIHAYAEKLLTAMGFVKIMDKYWVWPDKHLKGAEKYAKEFFPPDCLGMQSKRFKDMETLLRNCQTEIAKSGPNFNGVF